MAIKYFFISVFFLSLLACNEKKKPVEIEKESDEAINYADLGLENLNASQILKDICCQCWDYKEDREAAPRGDDANAQELVYRGFCFFKDGTAIKDPRGYMQAGKWQLDESVKPMRIRFKPDKGATEEFQLAYLMPYEMMLARFSEGEKIMIDMSSDAIRHINVSTDPFHISNMAWRIKPAKKENRAQLIQRLKGCLHFYNLFYKHHINAVAEEINFTGLPSCFRWYAGGIFLKKKTDLTRQWFDCFYDEDQAMEAYDLADKLIGYKYQWPKGETNWLKQNQSVLLQMEKKVDSL